MKTVISTGEHLIEDVADALMCHECEGAGYFKAPSLELEETECLSCHGTGLNWK